MYEAVMIAATGLQNQQRRIDTIANNVANVNSVGYKSARLDFKDALYTAGIVPGLPRTPAGNQQKGHGVMVAGIAKDYATGNFASTERQLDFAIEGEGFFELSDANGNLCYTRNGSFYIDDDGWLVNGEGRFILDSDGGRIQAPYGTDTVRVTTDGMLTFIAEDEDEMTVALGIYTFRNVTGLFTAGGGNYTTSLASGEKMTAYGASVRQGTLEMSNVNLAEEMTRLIRTQRAFSLASKALTTADEMEGIANNLRR